MINILVLQPADVTTLAGLNAASPRKSDVLTPETLTNGTVFLNADLLTDCGPTGTWGAWGAFLQSLQQESVSEGLLRPPVAMG
jgi:hypothetical protein